MGKDLYDLLALAGRYVFAALMLLIVFRAWRITIVDNRRARKLRQLAPQTGLSGELVVLDGGEKAPNGTRYPVIREGIIGSSRRADVRIRHSSVRGVHAFFELTEEGLRLRTHGSAEMSRSWEENERELLLKDGDAVELGGVQLLLVLSGAQGGARVRVQTPPPRSEADDLFAVAADEPAPRTAKKKKAGASRRAANPAYDAYDDAPSLAEDLFEAPAVEKAPARAARRDGLYSLEEFPPDEAPAPRKRPSARKKSAAPKRMPVKKPRDPDEDIWL